MGCGAQYYFGKVEKLPDPPTGARTLGSAVHHALGENFSQKVETKEDLPTAGVIALYRDAWEQMLLGDFRERRGYVALPTEFRDDEDPNELRAMGETLTRLYMDNAAPAIEPAAVELPVEGVIGGVKVRGYIDLLDVNGTVIDIKTAAKKPSGISAGYAFQVATYAQLVPDASGKARVDTLVKTKSPALVQKSLQIEQSDVDATAKLYPLVQKSIRAGVWVPNRASHLCGRRYCGFWRACERSFGGHVSE
jgi:RecB family exonuclease